MPHMMPSEVYICLFAFVKCDRFSPSPPPAFGGVDLLFPLPLPGAASGQEPFAPLKSSPFASGCMCRRFPQCHRFLGLFGLLLEVVALCCLCLSAQPLDWLLRTKTDRLSPREIPRAHSANKPTQRKEISMPGALLQRHHVPGAASDFRAVSPPTCTMKDTYRIMLSELTLGRPDANPYRQLFRRQCLMCEMWETCLTRHNDQGREQTRRTDVYCLICLAFSIV